MQCCGIDRILRMVVGVVLMGLAASGIVGVWGWIGIVPLATGLFRFCPAYPILKINTCGTGSSLTCSLEIVRS